MTIVTGQHARIVAPAYASTHQVERGSGTSWADIQCTVASLLQGPTMQDYPSPISNPVENRGEGGYGYAHRSVQPDPKSVFGAALDWKCLFATGQIQDKGIDFWFARCSAWAADVGRQIRRAFANSAVRWPN